MRLEGGADGGLGRRVGGGYCPSGAAGRADDVERKLGESESFDEGESEHKSGGSRRRAECICCVLGRRGLFVARLPLLASTRCCGRVPGCGIRDVKGLFFSGRGSVIWFMLERIWIGGGEVRSRSGRPNFIKGLRRTRQDSKAFHGSYGAVRHTFFLSVVFHSVSIFLLFIMNFMNRFCVPFPV